MSNPHYVAGGFKQDIRNLLEKFEETRSLRFVDFSTCWKEMKFSLVFTGKAQRREQCEFIDECYILILDEFVRASDDFQKVVGCFYLLYGMYMKQPLEPKVSIRVTLEVKSKLDNLVAYARTGGHLDILVIWKKLVTAGAVHYVFTTRPCGPVFINRNVPLGNVQPVQEQAKVLTKSMEQQIAELSSLNGQYVHMKQLQNDPEIDELNGASDDIYQTIQTMMADFSSSFSGEQKGASQNESSEDQDSENIGAKRRRLRNRTLAVDK